MSHFARNPIFGVSDQVRYPTQTTKEDDSRGLKSRIIKEEEVLFNLCSKYKGTDQLCGNHVADLRLCFCICKKQVFSRGSSCES